MKERFERHIGRHFPYLQGKRLLLAVSGGVDSMVMWHLVAGLGYDYAVAHVNFGLRGSESDGDEDFVRREAERRGVPFYVHRPETEVMAKAHRKSVQEAAREIRYRWFLHLAEAGNYDYILTAHHAGDSVESFFINTGRRTGLQGLTGIPERNGKVIRPLLPFSRSEILAHAERNGIEWREDSSNAQTYYLRNAIRHKLLPLLEEIMPGYSKSVEQVMAHLRQSRYLVEDYMEGVKRELLLPGTRGSKIIPLDKLAAMPHPDAVLYELLKDYGFTAWEDVYHLPEAQTGKTIFSPTHRLIKNRDSLLLAPRTTDTAGQEYRIGKQDKIMQIETQGQNIRYEILNYPVFGGFEPSGKGDSVFFDGDNAVFPLTLRRWRHGDFFYPLGMKGKKKISDFLTDRKVNRYEKENIYVLCDAAGRIMWIVGMRTDGRFRITGQTKNVLEIKKLQASAS